jgi:hypothetical protein
VDILTKTSEITPVKEAQKQNKLAVEYIQRVQKLAKEILN